MRFAILFSAITLLISLSSCEEFLESTDEVKINMPINKQDFSVDSSLLGLKNEEILLHEMRVRMDIDSLLKAEGLEYLSKARVNEMILGVDEPAFEKLYFLNKAKVTISDEESFKNEILVAYADNVDTEENSIHLQVVNMDVAREIRVDGFYLRIYATPSAPIYKSGIEMFIKGKVSLEMDNS